MNILITGCGGFIGYHLSNYFLQKGFPVYGIDNINNYYDIKLKLDRLKILKNYKLFSFKKLDINEKVKLNKFISNNKIEYIFNLAAQAGVRNSFSDPKKYETNNINGFNNLLEIAKDNQIKHIFTASTSSIYGNNKKFPLKEKYITNDQLSFYALTKKINEITARFYSDTFDIKITVLRFFTVYGPYGRPDMSLYKFVDAIFKNKTINLFNNGNHIRDFTYIDDVVKSIYEIFQSRNRIKNKFSVYNICSSNPHSLKKYLKLIEHFSKKKAKIKNLPLQQGDIYKTYGSNSQLYKLTKYKPDTKIETGIQNFIKWYKSYKNLN